MLRMLSLHSTKIKTMKRSGLLITLIILVLASSFAFSSCGRSADTSDEVATAEEMTEIEDVTWDGMTAVTADQIKDGIYEIDVDSSSSMFNIKKCELTVSGDSMTAVMTMGGTGYRYIAMLHAEEAADADESAYTYPEEDAEGKHTFTVEIDALDKAQPCAAFSDNKEKWYDRTLVFRSSAIPLDAFEEGVFRRPEELGLADGEYKVDVTLQGGTGKASVDSPAVLKMSGDSCTAVITWSSPHYDYMIADGERYDQINTEGNSVFEIPVQYFDRPMPVIADTTAMSEPHEIEYTLLFDSGSIR